MAPHLTAALAWAGHWEPRAVACSAAAAAACRCAQARMHLPETASAACGVKSLSGRGYSCHKQPSAKACMPVPPLQQRPASARTLVASTRSTMLLERRCGYGPSTEGLGGMPAKQAAGPK